MKINWTDASIDAAWKAFWGDNYQIEKADMEAALDAACKVQGVEESAQRKYFNLIQKLGDRNED